MKPREQGGVLDPRLNVYGVENLKVAGELKWALMSCKTLTWGRSVDPTFQCLRSTFHFAIFETLPLIILYRTHTQP